jgi:hypothetical protein
VVRKGCALFCDTNEEHFVFGLLHEKSLSPAMPSGELAVYRPLYFGLDFWREWNANSHLRNIVLKQQFD